jgi:hypothetical protein
MIPGGSINEYSIKGSRWVGYFAGGFHGVTNCRTGEESWGEKAKAQKVSGDIGLLDTEKNYMIVVTKDGKLVTVDYNQKTKVTELKEKPAKMSDIGLGSAATVEYTQKGDKNFLSKIEFTPAKGE